MTRYDDLMDDDLMDSVRRAQPDERASARTPAAQALIEEILSMETIEAPDANADHVIDLTAGRRRGGRRRLGVLAGAAAVAVALVAGAIVAPWSTEESAADALIRASALATREALADTGRATRTTFHDGIGPEVLRFDFVGDDERYTYPTPDGIYDNRVVDGYNYILNFDPRHPDQWYRVLCNVGNERETPDPRTLVEALTADADFEIVGEEDVDGVRTTHLRARNPGAIPASSIGELMSRTTVTAFDVWVDGDDVARRFDATVETELDEAPLPEGLEDEQFGTGPLVTEWSLQFFDLGEDIDIAAPTEFEDFTACEGP